MFFQVCQFLQSRLGYVLDVRTGGLRMDTHFEYDFFYFAVGGACANRSLMGILRVKNVKFAGFEMYGLRIGSVLIENNIVRFIIFGSWS